MKKYLILTSLSALVACGGGSGGSINTYNSGDIIPAGTTGTVTERAAKSNSNVTSMVSEIGVATDGTTINIGDTNRSATNHFTYGGKEYTSYRLDNVHFQAGPSNGQVNEDEYVTFGINENTGEINRVVYHDGDAVYEQVRQNDTNVFAGNVYKYYLNGHPQTDSFDEKPSKQEVRDAIAENLRNEDESVQNYYLILH